MQSIDCCSQKKTVSYNNKMKFLTLIGEKARPYVQEIAKLRLEVFWDYPYLYEGSLAYEEKYLENYFKCEQALVILVECEGKIVGASTGILADFADPHFYEPLNKLSETEGEIFYFGESVLLKTLRGQGIGKKFFELREEFALSIPTVKMLAFCAVDRPKDHPLCPTNYRALDPFWKAQGFSKRDDIITNFAWKDRDSEKETQKKMIFWTKDLRRTNASNS
jgi:GNAT superfamily N-acetyltransferase